MILRISNKEILNTQNKIASLREYKLRKKVLIVLNCLGSIFKIKIIEDPSVMTGTAVLEENDGRIIQILKDTQ